jgi:large repetitive protein
VTGAVTNGTGGAVALQVGSAAGDTLKLDAASSVTSASFLGSNGTLEFNASGTLTIANALAVGANALALDLAGSTLTDAGGVTLAGGSITGLGRLSAATNITGYGTVSLALDVADVVTDSGGTLRFTNQVDASSATAFHIASASGNALRWPGRNGRGPAHRHLR